MSLYLVESILSANLRDRAVLEKTIEAISNKVESEQGSLIEIQVASDLVRAFFVVDVANQNKVREAFSAASVPVSLIKPVRLVGQQLEDIKKTSAEVRYLVEWNLPEGLTMDAYIARKKEKSAHYAEVPEVSFIRTYVCEDMTKCLCFYDSPDEELVHKARKAVGAPVDTITETVALDKKSAKK